MGGGSSATQQAQQNQQQAQQQAEQYLQSMLQQGLTGLQGYLKANPNPASTWSPITGPTNMTPATVGGGPKAGESHVPGAKDFRPQMNPLAQALGGYAGINEGQDKKKK